MDAFAVGLASGIVLQKVTPRQTFRLAWHFGFFQFAMPVFGWFLGCSIQSWMASWDHWIAFVFLGIIGLKMIYESFAYEEKHPEYFKDPSKGWTMVMLSIATSIDAFAVGLSMCFLGISIWWPATVIGIVTCVLTSMAMYLGSWIGAKSKLGHYAECLGGVILLSIGIKILCDHTIHFC